MILILSNFIIGFTIISVSWIIGFIVFAIIKKNNKQNIITRIILFKNQKWYKYIGINIFRNIIIKTPLNLFNQIKISKYSKIELERVKGEIEKSEISHLVGFVFSQLIACCFFVCFNKFYMFLSLTVLNIFMNLYPVLLQQMNRQKITTLLTINNFK